jgi:serine/threonine-protein kinase
VAGTALLNELRQALPARYVVDGAIGAGGQGSVFRGSVDGTPAALKLFNVVDDPRRVQREIDVLRQVNCPSLVKVLAAEQLRVAGADVTLVAYELHTGGDLTGLLAQGAPVLTEPQLASVGHDVGAAVDVLWAKRIVHRDIKPANIMKAASGGCVLVDVGLARHLDRSGLTGAGFAVGTPGYMSPEQARGRRDLTVHSDSFSLGVTLYELAAKAHPFGRNQVRINGGAQPAPLASLRPDLSAPFCRAIHQMMAALSAARPRSLAAFFQPFVGGP